MTQNKHQEEAHQKVKEMIQSIKAIKGEQYAEIVEFLSMGVHLTKMIAVLVKPHPAYVAEAMGNHISGTLDTAAGLIFAGYKISEQDQDEMMTWIEKISDQIDFGLHQTIKDKK